MVDERLKAGFFIWEFFDYPANIPAAAYHYYGNDTTNMYSYGLIYSWYAVNDKRNIAQASWNISVSD